MCRSVLVRHAVIQYGGSVDLDTLFGDGPGG